MPRRDTGYFYVQSCAAALAASDTRRFRLFRVRVETKKKEAYASPFSRASRSRFSGSVSWSSASANLRYAFSIDSDIVCPFQLAYMKSLPHTTDKMIQKVSQKEK